MSPEISILISTTHPPSDRLKNRRHANASCLPRGQSEKTIDRTAQRKRPCLSFKSSVKGRRIFRSFQIAKVFISRCSEHDTMTQYKIYSARVARVFQFQFIYPDKSRTKDDKPDQRGRLREELCKPASFYRFTRINIYDNERCYRRAYR